MPGTPVVDLQNELVGTVVAVTPAFCVFEVEGALCVSPWRDVAIGNVSPPVLSARRSLVAAAY